MEKILSIFREIPGSLLFAIFTIVAFVILAYILSGFIEKLSKKSSEPRYIYSAKQHIMTKREEAFFETLCEIFGDKCHILPQIHLSSLFDHKIKGQNWQHAFYYINGKSVDYVLLRRKDLSILCAVELDDSTHDITERIKRDKIVEKIFDNAKIPLIRLRNRQKMAKQEIVDYFAKTINETSLKN